MHRGYLKLACILALLTVIMGAAGAHSLKKLFSDNAVEIYETGIKYQFYHTLAIFIVGILYKEFPGRFLKLSGLFFLLGIVLFSGSLYVLTYAKGAVQPGFEWVGPITPIGGFCFMIGWILMLIAIVKKSNS